MRVVHLTVLDCRSEVCQEGSQRVLKKRIGGIGIAEICVNAEGQAREKIYYSIQIIRRIFLR